MAKNYIYNPLLTPIGESGGGGDGGGSTGGLEPVFINSNTTIEANKLYVVDDSANNVVLSLPSSMSAGFQFGVVTKPTLTNSVSIDNNGHTIVDVDEPFIFDYGNAGIQWVYDGTTLLNATEMGGDAGLSNTSTESTNAFNYASIAVIDGDTIQQLGGSEFEGFIDEKPDHISTTVVKAGTKFTTTRETISTLHEVTSDITIPIGVDGDFTVWIDKDKVVRLGEQLNLTKKSDKTLEVAEFTADTTSGVGIATYSSRAGSGYSAFKALNHTTASDSDAWIAASGDTTGWINVELETAITINGFSLTPRYHAGDETRMPKDFTIEYSESGSTVDTTAGTYTDVVFENHTHKRYFKFDSPITVKTYKINVTANGGDSNYLAIGEFDLLTIDEGMYYDITCGNLYNDGVITEECPLGQVTISGGAITDVNSFYHGTKACVPINNGNNISTNTTYSVELPFPLIPLYNQTYLYVSNNWRASGDFIYNSDGDVSYGVKAVASIADNAIKIATGNGSLGNTPTNCGAEGDLRTTSAKALTIIERGY